MNNDMSFETLNHLIKYIYTKQFEEDLEEAEVKGILRAAKYLNLDIVDDIVVQVGDVLSVSNVSSFFKLIDANSAKFPRLCNYVFENLGAIRLEKSFLNASFAFVEWVLKQDSLDLQTEMEVFKTIARWINHDYMDRHQYLPSLLRCIRYTADDPDRVRILHSNFIRANKFFYFFVLTPFRSPSPLQCRKC